MHAHTITLVRASRQRVEAIAPAAAALFYDNLFVTGPSLRPFFKSDLQLQGERLMSMIGAAVAKLADVPTLVPVLRQPRARHAAYGDEHYDVVGAALLKAQSQGLGDEFTPELRETWTGVYEIVASTMRHADADVVVAGDR